MCLLSQFCTFAHVKTNGLTTAEAAASRREHGENVLTPPRRQSVWRQYLEKYNDPMVTILLIASLVSLCLSFFTGEYIETIGILLAVFLATTVGFYFERDAARKFDVLMQADEEQPVKVVRDGSVVEIARRDVVVGDLVIVETGDEVPADGRLVTADGLQVDESSLTGEQMAEKGIGTDDAGATYPADMLLRSSMVVGGSGHFLVTAVGDATEIGKVARQATDITGVKTPLNIQLDRLARLISKAGSAVAIVSFLAFTIHDMLTNPLWHTSDYMSMGAVVLKYFMMAVTLIVMAVPEGLPMAVTLALALNMRRMLKSNNLVRKLQASETIGAVTVICTDKTGTLTENRMMVSDVNALSGSDGGELFAEIALNTTAELSADGSGIGNPTEVALLRWMANAGTDYRLLRSGYHVLDRLPFSTERKYMATLVERDGRRQLFVKGAPEIVMSLCGMSAGELAGVQEWLGERQRKGMRTLELASAGVDALTCSIPAELPALRRTADVAISDPLRSDVPSAVSQCRQAGIDIKVVTGDTEATAVEIARHAGIIDTSQADGGSSPRDGISTITGPEFAAMDDAQALQMVGTLRVMSRARPTDKQRLVSLLQQRGEVVAVTGDGTNDAPALNRAHVGLSLGSGTSVAKEASDITLIDDSFRSIVNAVMWGRSLYKNIQRFIFFQLTVNVAALLLVLSGSLIGTEMPLTITQILWVNLIMDTFAAMALASLPPSREVMGEQPRSSRAFIITAGMGRGILLCGVLFAAAMFALLWYFEKVAGVDTWELTVFFTIFVMLQWWNMFNARQLGSCHSAFRRLWACRSFLLVLALIIAGQWLIVTFGGRMFRTVPLSWHTWMLIIVGTSPVLFVGELYRFAKKLCIR